MNVKEQDISNRLNAVGSMNKTIETSNLAFSASSNSFDFEILNLNNKVGFGQIVISPDESFATGIFNVQVMLRGILVFQVKQDVANAKVIILDNILFDRIKTTAASDVYMFTNFQAYNVR